MFCQPEESSDVFIILIEGRNVLSARNVHVSETSAIST